MSHRDNALNPLSTANETDYINPQQLLLVGESVSESINKIPYNRTRDVEYVVILATKCGNRLT